MKRRTDWQLRFSEFARARASLPFEWGKNDCCLFAADCVLALTDEDPALSMRGSYSDVMGAVRLIDDKGSLKAIADQALGESISPLFASVGDVVLLMNEGREMLAVCNGELALAPGEKGSVPLPMTSALAAWRI